MKQAFSYEQMREADRNTIEAAGINPLQLMARAGKALKDAVLSAMERLKANEVLFVCGGGNNGGDGFVAAQMLVEMGKAVSVLCLAERFTRECLTVKNRYEGDILGRIPRRKYRIVVDCVFGTGISRAPEGVYAALIEFIGSCGAYVISADVPSGLGENGVAFTPCVTADETICMGQMKTALLLEEGADRAGKITVVDVGIATTGVGRGADVLEDKEIAAFFPQRKNNVNKGDFGTACILAGSSAYSGAAFLSAGACLKSGVGYTRLTVTDEMFPYAIGKLPACILRKFDVNDEEILSCNSVALGMGAGITPKLFAFIKKLITEYTGTLILDADALNAIAKYGLNLLSAPRTCKLILTPHLKEFSRLSGIAIADIRRDMVGVAKRFAKKFDLTLLLKSNGSVITDGVRVTLNATGSPAQAKGGSGDVLSGFLAGTCARGLSPFDACSVAAYVCGRAGELAADEVGEYSCDASDLITYIPRAIKRICGLS